MMNPRPRPIPIPIPNQKINRLSRLIVVRMILRTIVKVRQILPITLILLKRDVLKPSELAEDNEGNNEPTGGNPTGDNIIEDDTDVINPSESESDEASSTNVEDESNFSSAQWEILADLLDAFLGSDEDSEDYHDALAKEIEGIASKVSDDVKAEFGASEWDIPDLLIDLNVYNEALSLSHSIGSDLSVLQQVKMRGRNKTHERGITFDGNRLILSPMGVRDVFRAQSESKIEGMLASY